MVANCPPGSPLSWRPTSRTLGALFAGSAVMFSAAALQGGTLFTSGDEVPAATASQAEAAAAGWSASGATSAGVSKAGTAPVSAPAQAAAGIPGVAPDQGTRLADRPIHRAPVRAAPQRSGPAPADASADTDGSSASRLGGSSQPDGTVLDDVLGYFVKGFGG